jgi:hypothetical protein
MDHRSCLLRELDPEWVWVEAITDVATDKTLPKMRGMLSNPTRWLQLVGLLTAYYWDPHTHVQGRQIQHLHLNPSNWPLIPFMPTRFRYPNRSNWGAHMLQSLEENGHLDQYNLCRRCIVCGNP